MIYLFRLCQKDEMSFDSVAKTGNVVAQKGNNVESTFAKEWHMLDGSHSFTCHPLVYPRME